MHEPDPPTEDLPTTGRHRATPPTLRQVALRILLGAGALGVVAALAVLTATWTGLTGTPPPVAQVQASPSADPPSGRSLSPDATRGGRAAPSTEASQPPAESPAPALGRAAADPPTSAPAPDPVSQPPSAPAAVPDVRSGAPCPAEGARRTTAAGKPVVCTVRGDGTPRWRHT